MASLEFAGLTIALTGTALALLLPWLQREEGFPSPWERKVLFAILLLDASLQWFFFSQLRAGDESAAWGVSLVLVAGANIGFAFYLGIRGFALPPTIRWTAVTVLAAIEPLFLFLSLAVLRAAVS